jgi:tetratricopeptide (TPR) repeat protein
LHLTPALEVPSVGRYLAELTRTGLIHAARSSSEREDAFRFHHVLIRDVAYASLPKLERADLHEGVAEWLDAQCDADDAIAGFHLEQAYRTRVEVGSDDRHTQRLAIDAGERLGGAGIAAWKRADAPATVNLLGRATVLLPKGHSDRPELLSELGVALRQIGEGEDAEAAFAEALAVAQSRGDRRAELRAEIELASARLLSDPEGRSDDLLALAAESTPDLEAFGDDRTLGRLSLQLAYVHGGLHCRNAEWLDAAERALDHYRRAGWPTSACCRDIAAALYHGPTPVTDGIKRCRALLVDADRAGEASVLVITGGLEAMRRRPGVGRKLVDQARNVFEELGLKQQLATGALWMGGQIALLGRDYRTAYQFLRESCDVLTAIGENAYLATFASDVAESLYGQQLYGEALVWTETAEAQAASDDVSAQFSWRSVRAKLLARGGFIEDALRLATDAVVLADGTDAINQHAKILLDKSEVALLAGRERDAAAAAEEALVLFEAKGNEAAARSARKLLGELAVA